MQIPEDFQEFFTMNFKDLNLEKQQEVTEKKEEIKEDVSKKRKKKMSMKEKKESRKRAAMKRKECIEFAEIHKNCIHRQID